MGPPTTGKGHPPPRPPQAPQDHPLASPDGKSITERWKFSSRFEGLTVAILFVCSGMTFFENFWTLYFLHPCYPIELELVPTTVPYPCLTFSQDGVNNRNGPLAEFNVSVTNPHWCCCTVVICCPLQWSVGKTCDHGLTFCTQLAALQ